LKSLPSDLSATDYVLVCVQSYDVNMRRAVKSLNCTRVVLLFAEAGAGIRPWSNWPATLG